MYVLSYVMPPTDGAKYGKAHVTGHHHPARAAASARDLLIERGVDRPEAVRFSLTLARKNTGTEWAHAGTGLVFRIDTEESAPNACPCCSRLVLPGDHALAGSDDAYCLGCYTWGDDDKIECDPRHSAHPNPWTINSVGARFSMEVVIDQDDETGHDVRYAKDETHELWDDMDNAMIAWPGLTRDRIISVEIKEI